jgi:hypothetical protein
MRIYDLLVEGATAILYHMTSVQAAIHILQDGEFKLASSIGSSVEEKWAPKGQHYFLSTSRSKRGDYARHPGKSAVMFVLDGQRLGQRYKVKPVDYWEGMWRNVPDRTSETEDRVFSKYNAIPIDQHIISVHLLITGNDEWRGPRTRQAMLLAKQRGIPAYLYTDAAAWATQDIRKSVSPAQAKELIKGIMPSRKQFTTSNQWGLSRWVELIFKKSTDELSEGAKKLKFNLVYYGLRDKTDSHGLATDLANARRPNDTDYPVSVKLIQYMTANHFSSPVELKNMLAAKWDGINTAEWEAKDAAKAAAAAKEPQATPAEPV